MHEGPWPCKVCWDCTKPYRVWTQNTKLIPVYSIHSPPRCQENGWIRSINLEILGQIWFVVAHCIAHERYRTSTDTPKIPVRREYLVCLEMLSLSLHEYCLSKLRFKSFQVFSHLFNLFLALTRHHSFIAEIFFRILKVQLELEPHNVLHNESAYRMKLFLRFDWTKRFRRRYSKSDLIWFDWHNSCQSIQFKSRI